METRTLPTRDPLRQLPPEDRLLEFVEQQIAKMARYSKLSDENNLIGFFELNHALAEHQSINLGLISLYNSAKTELTQAQEAFDDWYADRYITMREELNPRSLSPTKWFSTKEIEMYVRNKYKDEYKVLNSERIAADQRVGILRRLLDSWSSQQFVLARLSKNVEAEMGGSSENFPTY
jgi:hypothetical protein